MNKTGICILFLSVIFFFIQNVYGEKDRYPGNEVVEEAGPLKITCPDIPESGVIMYNRYKYYQFSSSRTSDALSYEWTFDILLGNGSYGNISEGHDSTFPVLTPQPGSAAGYINTSGEWQCRIKLKVTDIDGNTEEAEYLFFIHVIPLKPVVKIVEIIPVGDFLCDIKVGMESVGAIGYYLDVDDEEAYMSWSTFLYGVGYIEYTIKDVYRESDYIFTFCGSSLYGISESVSIKYGPSYSGMSANTGIGENNIIKFIDKDNIQVQVPVDEVVILGADAQIKARFCGNDETINISGLSNGIYILCVKDKKGKMYTTKFVH